MAVKACPTPNPAPSTSVFNKEIFKGKVLFCTGGGSGICKGMTEAIMRHGADAIILGRKLDRVTTSAEELSKATGQTCIPAQADVRNPKSLQEAVAKCLEKFGRIDLVICGAAGNFLAPIGGLSENGFKTVIDIDTLGTYNTVKATLPHIRKSRGAYIHISATLHYRGTPERIQYQAHVSAAKAAVDALSQVIAVEEGPRGVRSNVIAPGPISGTEGAGCIFSSIMHGFSQTAGMDRLAPKDSDYSLGIPLARAGTIPDIANLAVYLFSDAGNYITGQKIAVDGGHMHTGVSAFPYPAAVLDPEGVQALIKPRL
ncbi:2,4-dienoyl-CoA reductase [Sistotremastrum niveocremeum HHB9708]|uniref:2,4-dienoyl-CoA reductase [(3E)-enoyl-CoA-producing] n=1 Tax=Sistotremastrum niveocremeum HHB9708 TaxID=1314777 RepID=A0A164SQC0_9AGAM|nr:2,4-dienoyl-CoA reductase [Sistotremastrum niveocremeum HHB9708]